MHIQTTFALILCTFLPNISSKAWVTLSKPELVLFDIIYIYGKSKRGVGTHLRGRGIPPQIVSISKFKGVVVYRNALSFSILN